MNAPAFWTYAKPAEDAPDYYSEADLHRWFCRMLTEVPAFIDASYRAEFGPSVPDLKMEHVTDALHDGIQDATAPFFTEINGGDL